MGLLFSCKPTEQNYRLAYEKAQEKARAGLEDWEYELMVENDLPPYMRTATDSVRGISENVIWQYTPDTVNGGRPMNPARYNLAVGKYTMLTNARGHTDRLASEGWPAVLLRNGKPEYFVVICMTDSLDEAADAAHRYTARYPHGTVSLPEPLVIVSTHPRNR